MNSSALKPTWVDWTVRNFYKVLITVITIGMVMTMGRRVWMYMVWDVVAESRTEQVLKDAMRPVTEQLELIRDDLRFRNYMDMRKMGKTEMDSLDAEWARVKGHYRRTR